MPAYLENSAVATGLEKVSFHSNPKECSNWHTIALISHASKVMLTILQARLQQYVNCEQMFQVNIEKVEELEVRLSTSAGSSKNQDSARKTSTSALLTYAKAFDSVDHNKLWKILQEMGIPDTLTCLLRTDMQVRKQQLELDMEQQTGSK